MRPLPLSLIPSLVLSLVLSLLFKTTATPTTPTTATPFPLPFLSIEEARSPPAAELPFGAGAAGGRDPDVRVALTAMARNNAAQLDSLPHRNGTCAVVGNSGVLANATFGAEIDSHDVVIRFNSAPAGGSHARAVGGKTTLRFLYYSWERKLLPAELDERAVVTAFSREGLLFFASLRGPDPPAYPVPFSRVLTLGPSFLAAVHARLGGGSRRWASSGAAGVALALHLCGPGRVDLYGFDTVTGGGTPMHYWDRPGQPNPEAAAHAADPATYHDYAAERAARAALAAAGAIRVRAPSWSAEVY